MLRLAEPFTQFISRAGPLVFEARETMSVKANGAFCEGSLPDYALVPDDENKKYAERNEQPPGAEQSAADYQQNHARRREADCQARIADLPESLLGQMFFSGPTLAPRGIL